MEIINQGIIFKSEPDTDRQSLISAGVCVLPDGRWLACCRAAPLKAEMAGQHVLLAYSDDEGRTWSTPMAPFTPPQIDGRPGLFRSAYLTALGGDEVIAVNFWVDNSEPSLPLFNEETQGILDCRIFLTRSGDGGQTWGSSLLVDTTPFNQPTPATGPILQLANGDWACQFELNHAFHDNIPWQHQAVLKFSRDGGRTWPEYSVVARHPENHVYYWDQRPTVLPDGKLISLFWTFDNQTAKYLNIHASESSDHGRTWCEPWDTGVPGQPAAAVATPDGRLVTVYVDREGAPAIKVRISSDRGRTWPAETETLLYATELDSQTVAKGSMQDAWSEMEKFSLGLPITTALPDGDILVLFYAGTHTDITDVRWARLRVGNDI